MVLTSSAVSALRTSLCVLLVTATPSLAQHRPPMPRYDHVFLIVEENQGLADIVGKPYAPNLTNLAHQYGVASHYYGVVHPSEGNYVAMLGGDNFGIHDDEPYFCKPGATQPACKHASDPTYPDHTVDQPDLAGQLIAHGLTWRAYEESLPTPGATDVIYPVPNNPDHRPAALYASKHDGFMNYISVQHDPNRAEHIVGFDALHADLASGRMPNFAFIVPNQCDDMHGLKGDNVPPDCTKENEQGRIARGDAVAGALVSDITSSPVWIRPGNAALVIITDEGGHHPIPGDPAACCGAEPGGHGLAIVVTNHGPRGVVDSTPYNHYSLLRTVEDAFGIADHLRHAGDTDKGVVGMAPLFVLAR